MEDTYALRNMEFFKDETKGEHLKRMKRAKLHGDVEKNEPLKVMLAELVVAKNATPFAKMLQSFGFKFRETKGVGVNSFFIDLASTTTT